MDIKHFVEDRIFSKNYFLAKIGYLGWYRIKTKGKKPLLIYQMGKVASRTIQASLKAVPVDIPIIHLHCLSDPAIALAEHFYYDDIHGFNRHLKANLPHDLFASYYIRQYTSKNQLKDKKWKIITLVRDPVARNISGFFEVITCSLPDFYQRIGSITYSELLDAFLKSEEHKLPLTWFDEELKPFFGIDVYSTPFPKTKGYKIYTGEMADILLLRVEDLSRTFSNAIYEFLNIGDVNIVTTNTAKDKEYYDLYQMFVKNVTLPASYLEKMYNSKYARTFYTEEEIQRFLSRWGS